MKNFISAGFLLFFLLPNLLAQLPVNPPNICGTTPITGALTCRGACVDCNLDGFTELSLDPNPVTVATDCFGQPMTLTSVRWYAFIAGTTGITFQISPIKCNGFDGIQAIITSDCATDKVLGCTPGIAGNRDQPITISAFGLTPGNVYQLAVGGLNTTVCQYNISVLGGLARPQPMSNITSMDGPTTFCKPFNIENYSIAPVSNAAVYTWTAPPGSSIDGGGNTKTFRAPAGTNVENCF